MITQEPGHPEAGLQLDIFGMTTEVRPKGKGEIIQPTLEQYLLDKIKLDEWKQSIERGDNETNTNLP